jgi:uncharacterized repeat protein (TIGR01451 family)
MGGTDPSPAIDAGSTIDIDGTTVSVDQRGFGRPYGSQHDIGAYERGVADLVLVKTVTPAEANPGQALTYTLTFSNTGREPATGVVLTDPIPAGVEVTGVTSGGLAITDTGASPPYVWQVEDVAPDRGGVITLTGALSTALTAGTLTNTAILTTTEVDEHPDDNVDSAALTVVIPKSFVYLPIVLREH